MTQPRMLPEHLDRLAEAVRRKHPKVCPGTDFIWNAAPALRVIDCVLSLNRKYDTIVVPRVTRFASRFPQITACAKLGALIDSYPSAAAFLMDTLEYRFADRARILREVVGYMEAVQLRHAGSSELDRLSAWARSVHPQDYRAVNVKGFGLAGFQYMRMLFGAETTKPDIHIIRFVSEAVGADVSPLHALCLLEATARDRGVSLRWLDVAIWEGRARASP